MIERIEREVDMQLATNLVQIKICFYAVFKDAPPPNSEDEWLKLVRPHL